MILFGFPAGFLAQLPFAAWQWRDPPPIPLALLFNWFVCLLRPCRGRGTGFAFWASGGRRRWQGEGSCCRQLCSEGSPGMIDGTASPAVPAMRHSWAWQPPGALFPLLPPHNEALINTTGFPGCLLRHLRFCIFFSLFFLFYFFFP